MKNSQISNCTSMKHVRYNKKKVVYADGYDHYDKHKTIPVVFFISEAEQALLDDLMAVTGERNKSSFIRKAVFGTYARLSREQRQQMSDIADFRATEDGPLR